jgi:hypothetical protein
LPARYLQEPPSRNKIPRIPVADFGFDVRGTPDRVGNSLSCALSLCARLVFIIGQPLERRNVGGWGDNMYGRARRDLVREQLVSDDTLVDCVGRDDQEVAP